MDGYLVSETEGYRITPAKEVSSETIRGYPVAGERFANYASVMGIIFELVRGSREKSSPPAHTISSTAHAAEINRGKLAGCGR